MEGSAVCARRQCACVEPVLAAPPVEAGGLLGVADDQAVPQVFEDPRGRDGGAATLG